MWQAATLGGPKPYSSASSLPGFYSTGYPPTPPKDSQTPDEPPPPRTAAASSEEYINSSLSSSISSEDLMSNDMKPTPESLMGFPSFPYSSRKIQEGKVTPSLCSRFVLFCSFRFLPVAAGVNLCPASLPSDMYSGGGGGGGAPPGPPPLEQTTSPHSPVYYSGSADPSYPAHTFPPPPGVFHSKALTSPRQRTKARSNAGKGLCDLALTRPAVHRLTTNLLLCPLHCSAQTHH